MEYLINLIWDSSSPLFLTDPFAIGILADFLIFILEISLITFIIKKFQSNKIKKEKNKENIWFLNHILIFLTESIAGKRNVHNDLHIFSNKFQDKFTPNSYFYLTELTKILSEQDTKAYFQFSSYLTKIASEMNMKRSFVLYLKKCCDYYLNIYINYKTPPRLKRGGEMYGMGYTQDARSISFLWKNWDLFFQSWKAKLKCQRIGKNVWVFKIFFSNIYVHLIESKYDTEKGVFISLAYAQWFGQLTEIRSSWAYIRNVNNQYLYVGCSRGERSKYHNFIYYFFYLVCYQFAKIVTQKGAEISYKIIHEKKFLLKKFGEITSFAYKRHVQNITDSLNQKINNKKLRMTDLKNFLRKSNNEELSILVKRLKFCDNKKYNNNYGIIESGVYIY